MTEYSAIDQPAATSEEEVGRTEAEPTPTPPFADADFAARYGVKPGMSRTRKITLGVVGLCLLGGVAGYIAWNQANPQIQATVISYTSSTDSVTATIEVDKPADETVECTVQVEDVNGNVIGSANVPVSSGRSKEDILSTVNTTGTPNTVVVPDCVAG
jgi:hypothetical protein